MAFSAFEQFEILRLIPLGFGKFDISITNSTVFMALAVIYWVVLYKSNVEKGGLVPSRWQSVVEIVYEAMFDVVKDKEELVYKVTYLGKDDKISITDGYNKMMKELIKIFGFKDLSFQTISNAIIRAYCWFQDSHSPNEVLQLTSESCIAEVASSFSKQFTIPDIKQKLPDLTLTTKQVERILLLNNYNYKQYGTSRKKYFYLNSETN